MNFEYFVARRLLKQEDSTFSRPIVRIATVSIALSIAVMIVSVGVLSGFKNAIKEKITGFTSHLHIMPYSFDTSAAFEPFALSKEEQRLILSDPEVQSLEPYILQAGAIKTKESFQGVILKGVRADYDSTFFKANLTEGRLPNYRSNGSETEVLLSKSVADKMKTKVGDKIRVYFLLEGNYRVRPFKVVGLYSTGLGDYDNRFILASASLLQRLNKTDSTSYGGYEVKLKHFSKLHATADRLYRALPQDKTVASVDQMEPGLFSWLSLLDSNVILIIIVMTLVTITATCSTLLIMVFEQTAYIGLLKSFGARTRSIIRIYIYKAAYIIGRALVWGNAIALIVGAVQSKYKIIKLDPESYYLDSVPVELNVWSIILVNVAVVAVSLCALLIPARSIGRISPANSIRKN